MKTVGQIYFVVIIFALILLGGCQKQNPVQLRDDEVERQGLEVENASDVGVEPFDASASGDTTFFITTNRKFLGKLIVAGSEYDSPVEHHEASLARAVFYNRADPILFAGDTVGFRTIDAGIVSVDNLVLRSSAERLDLPGIPIDSIGLQYTLLNLDGLGGKGFRYFGDHTYQWKVTGGLFLPAFQETIKAPARLHVTAPVAGERLSLSRNLTVLWRGGGEVVRILISDFRTGKLPQPLLSLKLRNNGGQVILPARILQLLPRDRARLLFTVSSEESFAVHLNGYEDIILRSITSHSLVYSVIE